MAPRVRKGIPIKRYRGAATEVSDSTSGGTVTTIQYNLECDDVYFTPHGVRSLSPRSHEALKQLGANPEDLIPKKLKHYYKPGINLAVQQMRFNFFEQERKELVEEGIKVRRMLIENFWTPNQAPREKRYLLVYNKQRQFQRTNYSASDPSPTAGASRHKGASVEPEERIPAYLRKIHSTLHESGLPQTIVDEKKRSQRMLQIQAARMQSVVQQQLEYSEQMSKHAEREKARDAKLAAFQQAAEENRRQKEQKKAEWEAQQHALRRKELQAFEASQSEMRNKMKKHEQLMEERAAAAAAAAAERQREVKERLEEKHRRNLELQDDRQNQLKQKTETILQRGDARAQAVEEMKASKVAARQEKVLSHKLRVEENQKEEDEKLSAYRQSVEAQMAAQEERMQAFQKAEDEAREMNRAERARKEEQRLAQLARVEASNRARIKALKEQEESFEQRMIRFEQEKEDKLMLEREKHKLTEESKKIKIERKRQKELYERKVLEDKIQEDKDYVAKIKQERRLILQERDQSHRKAECQKFELVESFDRMNRQLDWQNLNQVVNKVRTFAATQLEGKKKKDSSWDD